MDPIALTFGSNRVIHGNAIPHPLSAIYDDPEEEYKASKEIIIKALEIVSSECE